MSPSQYPDVAVNVIVTTPILSLYTLTLDQFSDGPTDFLGSFGVWVSMSFDHKDSAADYSSWSVNRASYRCVLRRLKS